MESQEMMMMMMMMMMRLKKHVFFKHTGLQRQSKSQQSGVQRSRGLAGGDPSTGVHNRALTGSLH